jgi:spermidine/putrescine-binding protein
MKIKSILLSSLLALGCTAASAQEEAKTVNVFNPHGYLQLQVGGQETLALLIESLSRYTLTA